MYKLYFLVILQFALYGNLNAQLIIDPAPNAQALAQRLVGDGVSITNVTFVGNPLMAAYFKNNGGTNIGLDSGIVLTNGRAKSNPLGTFKGVDGNGISTAQNTDAHNEWNIPGDNQLAVLIGSPLSDVNDACILEFDFVPLGDSIKFRYVFSSEEYDPAFVCDFNDAFAFFISGPGFTGSQNIALVPGTNTPVSIRNVNNIPTGGCVSNPTYYIDNLTNVFLSHDGQTVVLTALARVQPCQTYHLKLVIADAGFDADYDSGVFLEARSLSSNATQLINLAQTDPITNSSYLVEGCSVGSLNIKRLVSSPQPLTINLSYGGTIQNGIDVQTLPPFVTIPANQDSVLLNIFPNIDLVPEGIETLIIYTLAACSSALPTDSTLIQIRDYDTLGIVPDSAIICGSSSIQLQATVGYTTYTWDNIPGLSNYNIPNPMANPPSGSGTYYCTASVGSCQSRDSVFIQYKEASLRSFSNVNCRNASTGQISVGGGLGWVYPLQFSLNGGPYQADSTFNNLPVGTYTIFVKDASGCIDSIVQTLTQNFPDLTQTNSSTPAGCSGNPDGTITVTAAGGNPLYTYSINGGTSFVSSNVFNVVQGSFNLIVKDANGCTVNSGNITVGIQNDLVVDAGVADSICEGSSTQLLASSNASIFSWSPSVAISNTSINNPVVSPVITTQYFVTVTQGICTKKDSVTILVYPAPIANAGTDITICFGASTQLIGTGGTEFTWTPATYLNSTTVAQPAVQRPLSNIVYTLRVKDNNGCGSLQSDMVSITVTPAVSLFAGRDTSVANNQPVQLNVIQNGSQTVTNYNWSPPTGLDNPNIRTPIATLDRDILYIVKGTTPANCEGTDSMLVKRYKGPEIYVPTVFTPNGDGNNDILRALAFGMTEYRYFRIFNRWGQQVFFTKDFSRGWDGRIQGKMQETGTFVWMAEAVDFRGTIIKRKGTTTLMH
jgi:gliding motility-associated-like protein